MKLDKITLAHVSRVSPLEALKTVFVLANIQREILSGSSQWIGIIKEYLISQNHLDEAIMLLSMIVNHSFKQQILKEIVTVLSKAGKLTDAINIASSLVEQPLLDQARENIVTAMAIAHRFSEAVAMASTMPTSILRSGAQVDIVDEFLKIHRLDEAIAFAESLKKKGKDGECLNVIFARLIKYLLKTHEIRRAIALIPEINSFYSCLWAHVDIVEALISVGKWDEAKKFIDSIRSSEFRENVREHFADSLSRLKKFDEAIEIVDLLAESNQNVSFWNISTNLAKDKQFDRAVEIANRIPQQSLRPRVMCDLIIIMNQQGEYKRALTLALTLSYNDKWAAIKEIVKSLCEIGGFVEADRLSRKIEEDSARENVFKEIVLALMDKGQYDDAEALVLEIKIREIYQDTLSKMSIAYAKADQFDKALTTVSKISYRNTQDLALNVIIAVTSLRK
jgi:tetratricopeptide (TPR) repeat protein